jgi:hypothetical protein
MRSFKTTLGQLLLITLMALPWTTTQALDTFEQAGYIDSIGSSTLTVKNQKYRLDPSLELVSNDIGKQKYSDLKKGDPIYFKGKILSGVHYVDVIYYETPNPS